MFQFDDDTSHFPGIHVGILSLGMIHDRHTFGFEFLNFFLQFVYQVGNVVCAFTMLIHKGLVIVVSLDRFCQFER